MARAGPEGEGKPGSLSCSWLAFDCLGTHGVPAVCQARVSGVGDVDMRPGEKKLTKVPVYPPLAMPPGEPGCCGSQLDTSS